MTQDVIAPARSLASPVSYWIHPGKAGATVVNRVSGYRWARGLSGRWRQTTGPAISPVSVVAALIADPTTTGEDIGAVLRQTVVPWITVLSRATRIARTGMGVSAGRVRQMHDLAHAVMADSEQRPHRIMMVVVDPGALAAAYSADADLEVGPARLALRYNAVTARRSGAGRWPVTIAYPMRDNLTADLVALLAARRPGQTYLAEPAPAGTA
jgi:hypothetical protein